jgi:hypothetical protein
MYEIMFYAGMACFVLGCIVSIILFVKNDIAKAIGDVTGHNARKAMKKMQQEREEKEQSGAKKKKEKKQKEKREFFGKMRDEKTSVLLNPEERTDILSKAETGAVSDADSQTDVLPQPSQRSEEILQRAQTTVDFSNVFQVEEEMTVLGGEPVDVMPTTILSDGVSFGSKLDADLEATSVLRDDVTDVLTTDDATDVLVAEDATDVLIAEEATSVLAAEDATDVLVTEDATDVLKTRVATNKK